MSRRRVGAISLVASLAALAVCATPAFAERTYDSQIAGLSNPQGIAIDGSDNVWIDNYGESGSISEYDSYPSQTLLGTQNGGGHHGGYILSLAINNSNGRLYLADSGPVDVDVYESGLGSFEEQWKTKNSCGLDHVAVDNSGGSTNGRVYIARSCDSVTSFVNKHEEAPFSASGEPGKTYINGNEITGTPGGVFPGIQNIATDSGGNIYVVVSGGVVDEFAPSGTFIQSFTGAGVPGGFSSDLAGVAIDPTNGNVLVVDQGNNVVDEFEESGTYLGQLKGTGPSESTPFGHLTGGIAVNSSGYVYVSDENGSVDIFTSSAILPKVTYEPVTGQTQTAGTLNASINLNGGPEVTACTFQYGTTIGYGSTAPCVPAPPYKATTAVSAELSGLKTETPYHYRVVLTTANGTKKGNDQTYIPHAVAGLTTEAASLVERNNATLNGTFNGNGEDTHYYFEWGTTGDYGNKTPVEDAGTAAGPQKESYLLTGLQVETVYHFRIVAENGVGTSYGSDQSFKTLAAVENLETEPASEVTASTANLNATYNGIGEDVHYYFEWGTDASYGNVTAASPGTDHGSPSGPQSLSFTLEHLGVDTTYHYRVIASDPAGTTYGTDQTFSTLGHYQFASDIGSAGSGAGELSNPQDVAVNNSTGNIYVADTGNHRVVEFDAAGNSISAWGWGVSDGKAASEICTSSCQAGIAGAGPGQFSSPKFIEVDNSPGPSAGDVYVADTASGLVQKFNPSGELIQAWGEKGSLSFSIGGTIGGITVDPAGSLYVLTDNSPFNWTEVSQDGSSETKYPTNGTWADGERLELGSPAGTGIEINSAEVWYEATGGGASYSSPAASEYSAFGIGSGSPSGLAINRANDDIYLDLGGFIEQFASTSECNKTSGCPATDIIGNGDLSSAAGLAVRPSSGTLYAANGGSNDLAVFSPLPAPTVTTGSPKDVTATSGTMTGVVEPAAGGEISACYFDYVPGPFENEIQNLKLSGVNGGTFTLSFEGKTTEEIPYTEGGYFGGSSVEYALENLSTIGSHNVRVQRAKGNAPYTVEFVGALAETNVPQLTVNYSKITPSGGTITPETVAEGHGWKSATTAPCTPGAPFAGSNAVSDELTGLIPFTTYHYKLVAINSNGKEFPTVGRERTFTPAPLLDPDVTETSASEINPTTARLNAGINPNFASTSYRFQYGTDSSYGNETLPSESIGEDGTPHSVATQISGLRPGTTYHYRVLALNFAGVTEGPDRTFNTPDVPHVSSTGASAITKTGATLSAQIAPGYAATNYHFEFGPTGSYGASVGGAVGDDNSIHTVDSSISGLAPGATYHYRVVATNAFGTATGPDQTFSTAPVVQELTPPPPVECKKGQVRRHGRCVKPKKATHKHRKPRRGQA